MKFRSKKNEKQKTTIPESKKVDKEIREKREAEKSEEKETKKEKKEEKKERINIVAKDIAKNFTYQQIKDAIEVENKAYEVYGYLEIHYDDWRDLLNEAIFDRACYYAKKDYKPELINVMSKIDLSQYKRFPVRLIKEYTFKNLPNRPFRNVVFYAPGDFPSCLKKIRRYELEIDGYDARVSNHKATFLLFGWALPNYPVILVSFTPGLHKAMFNLLAEVDVLEEDDKKLLKQIVFHYRADAKVSEMSVQEQKVKAERFYKKWQFGIDQQEYERPDWNVSEDENAQRDKGKEEIYVNKWLLYGILVIVGILVILMVVM